MELRKFPMTVEQRHPSYMPRYSGDDEELIFIPYGWHKRIINSNIIGGKITTEPNHEAVHILAIVLKKFWLLTDTYVQLNYKKERANINIADLSKKFTFSEHDIRKQLEFLRSEDILNVEYCAENSDEAIISPNFQLINTF